MEGWKEGRKDGKKLSEPRENGKKSGNEEEKKTRIEKKRKKRREDEEEQRKDRDELRIMKTNEKHQKE